MPKAQARHILVPSEAECAKLKKDIEKGDAAILEARKRVGMRA